MQYNITPILAAIGQTNESNVLSVVVNQDNGTTCRFQWQLIYQAPTISGQSALRPQVMGNGSFTISGTDYTSYTNEIGLVRLTYAANYVATHLVPSLSIINS